MGENQRIKNREYERCMTEERESAKERKMMARF
jgi:hypothetical protein